MKVDISKKHTFVVCAYKESQYLEECIQSVLNQNVKSKVIISTGTPNSYIKEIAEKYKLQLFVNPNPSSLASDWNFAMSCAETELITLAHQDDVYEKGYSENIWKAYNKSKNPIILFSDYAELRDGKIVLKNKLLTVKRIMLSPLKLSGLWNSRFVRRRILSFGSAICCPAVTLVKSMVPEGLFEDNMKSNIDWQAWERLSKNKGAFVYVSIPLMEHRIHEQSTTSHLLKDSARRAEDLTVFRKFWPRPVALLIEHVYQKGEKSNQLK